MDEDDIKSCKLYTRKLAQRGNINSCKVTNSFLKSESHFSYGKSVNTPQGTLIHFSSSLKDEEVKVTEQQQQQKQQ
jgi:hypothetical protein